MSALKVILYFISGFIVIAGTICVGIFFYNGSVPALGSGAMMLCFGFAGILVSVFLEPLARALKQPGSQQG